MTDHNEKLIDRFDRWAAQPNTGSINQQRRMAEFATELRDALEAAEKAHTPTDDERETLIQEWANVHQGPNAHAVLLEMIPIGDQMSLALRDALRELAALRAAGVS